jgi:MYXO-CTERM domain-containing protein
VSAGVSYAVWALLGVALLALWARSRSAGSSVARPAVVVERLATGPLLRVVLVACWMFTGWHLFAR